MSLSPEAQRLYDMPAVRSILDDARNQANISYRQRRTPWEDSAEYRREGHYPLVTHEGPFQCDLWRVIPTDSEHGFRGGEFRVLANEKLVPGEQPTSLSVIVDAIPIFLKELSDTHAQSTLTNARSEIHASNIPAALIQHRASDIHDGEYRNRPDGLLDIEEEVWFAKVLNIMSLYPGMSFQEASGIALKLGHKPFLADYGLGIFSVLEQYGISDKVLDLSVSVLDGKDCITPFPQDEEMRREVDLREVENMLKHRMAANGASYDTSEGKCTVWTLAKYPIMQDGVKFNATLLAVQKEGSIGIQTVRVLEYGDRNDAWLRGDSICTNGVQGGDTHCDCRRQSEVEKLRARNGISMILINFRDDEGRFHGEGKKGGTLAAQRAINEYILSEIAAGKGQDLAPIGNGLAAQLIYHETGERVDNRTYGAAEAALQYLGITHIPHLITDNADKITAFQRVCTIGEIVSAKVQDGLSSEAACTYGEKSRGYTGVQYHY